MHVPDALVLQAVVLGEEVHFTAARGRAEFRIVDEPSQAFLNLGSIGDVFEVSKSDLVLVFDPLLHFGRRVVFQPAIRVGYFDAVIRIDLTGMLGFRVRKRQTCSNCEGRNGGREKDLDAHVMGV